VSPPVDPDVDLRVPRQWPALAVIAAGGALGSGARYGVGFLLPHDPAHGVPWATLVINAAGCLLIGVLMAFVTERPAAHRLVRPFLGVGVLGGFTTFSTYTNELRTLLERGATAAGLGYLFLTLVLALAAVTLGFTAGRAALGKRGPA